MVETVKKNSTFGSGSIYLCDSFDVAKLDTEITSKLIDVNLLILSDDGTTFEEEKQIHNTELAGFNGKRVRGFENIMKAEGKISGTGRVANSKLLEASLYRREANTSTKYDVYSVQEDTIADSMYKDVVMVGVNKASEKAQIVVLKNAYNSNLSIETKSADDGSCKLEFISAYSLEALSEVPYKIITLKEVQA